MKITIDSLNKCIEIEDAQVIDLGTINKIIEAVGGNPNEYRVISKASSFPIYPWYERVPYPVWPSTNPYYPISPLGPIITCGTTNTYGTSQAN